MKMTRITILTSALITIGLAAVLSLGMMPGLALAAPKDDACAGIQAAGGSCSAGNDGFGKLVKTVINVLSIVVGAVSVVMIIVGGFRYVISGGDSAGIKGAKDTIMYALIGLVVVLFAQAIVAFVLDRAT